MKQITVRIDDDELEDRIEDLVRRERLSMNQAALRLMRAGAGIVADTGPGAVAASLDLIFGAWSEEEAREFDEAVAPLEEIDEELWK